MLQKIVVIGLFLVGFLCGGLSGFNLGKATSFIDGFQAAMETEFCNEVIHVQPTPVAPWELPEADGNGKLY